MSIRTLFFLLIFALLTPSIFAQSPRSFNYQAIARSASGQPLSNQAISVRFTVKDQSGTALYSETHQGTTNNMGLIILKIGSGTPESPFTDFADIQWDAADEKSIKVELDPQGGSSYTLSSENDFESVPYAMYSDKAGAAQPEGQANGDLDGSYPSPSVKRIQGRAVSAAVPATGNVLKWNGTEWAPEADATGTQWTASGTAIYNTNTGYVGLGTANPLAKLHLNNTVAFTEALRIQGNGSWLSFYDGSLYDGFLWNNVGNISLGTSHLNSSGSLVFYTYGGDRMRITPGGFVGIGIANPAYKLHVEASGVAIHGKSTSSYGMYAYSGGHLGIYGYSNATGSAGIFGQSAYIGVEGITNAGSTDGSRQGVRGDNSGAATGWAGYFWGNVGVSGSFSKGAGSFKIDHPLDPEHKFLYHSFVESPDMKNIYDGVVTTDGSGLATVSMPDWFEALNKEFRYQLTVIGEFAQAIIFKKLENGSFQIKTNIPNVEVSWQLTGIRKDPYAEQYRIPIEQDKAPNQMGKYLHPDVYGKPMEQAIDYLPNRGYLNGEIKE